MARDLRRYARQTNLRLLIGGIFILFLVGDGLIYVFFGKEAAIGGLICLISGLAPIILIWLILLFFQLIVNKIDRY